MIIKNISGKHFSLEGVIIEPNQSKELPDEQGYRFLALYAHVGNIQKIEPIDTIDFEEIKSGGAPIEEVVEKLEEKVEEIISEKEQAQKEQDATPPPLKVFKPRNKK